MKLGGQCSLKVILYFSAADEPENQPKTNQKTTQKTKERNKGTRHLATLPATSKQILRVSLPTE